jgi:hypothetical protein
MTGTRHTRRAAHTILLSLMFLGITPRAAAAADSTPGAPVELVIKPRVVLLGQPVVVSGVSAYHAKAKQLKIKITHESGKFSQALSTDVQPQGTFSTTFKDTKQLGRYTVEVTGPDGKNTAKGEFRVVDFGGLADELESGFTAIDKRQHALVKLVHDKVAALPPTPQRDQALQKVVELEKKMNEVTLPPKPILNSLREVVPGPHVVNLPDVKIFGQLSEQIDELRDTADEVDRTGVLNRKDDTICETINTSIEGAKLAGALFNVTGTVLEVMHQVFIDKSISSVVSQVMGEGAAATGVAGAIKVAAAGLEKDEGKIVGIKGGVTKAWTSIVFDIVELGTKYVYERYCERIDSPLRVKMRMVWTESGKPWYKYGVRLEGRLSLRYAKASPPGEPLTVTGELEGTATRFTMWENVLAVQPLPRGMIAVARDWLSPPKNIFAEGMSAVTDVVDFGEALRATQPYAFNVPVVGKVKGDEIEIEFKPARVDFSDLVRGRLLFVAVHPSLPVPEWSVFTFPIEKAQWIVRRGFGEPGKFTIKTRADKTGKEIPYVVGALDTHRDSPDKSITVDWQIRFDSRLKTVIELPDPTFPF